MSVDDSWQAAAKKRNSAGSSGPQALQKRFGQNLKKGYALDSLPAYPPV